MTKTSHHLNLDFIAPAMDKKMQCAFTLSGLHPLMCPLKIVLFC